MCERIQECVEMTSNRIENLITTYDNIKRELYLRPLRGRRKQKRVNRVLEAIKTIEKLLGACMDKNNDIIYAV